MNAVFANILKSWILTETMPVDPSPYFKKEVHNYLLSLGLAFKEERQDFLTYTKDEMRIVFTDDIKGDLFEIQYWFEHDDEDTGRTARWVTFYRFSMPPTLEGFKTILKVYLTNKYK